MNNIRIKPSKKIDFKSKLLEQYNDQSKGFQYKNLDFKKIEKEKEIKFGMPISWDRMTFECKKDIAVCDNFNILRKQLTKNLDATATISRAESPLSVNFN
jgi:hypothetical protein